MARLHLPGVRFSLRPTKRTSASRWTELAAEVHEFVILAVLLNAGPHILENFYDEEQILFQAGIDM